MTEATDSTVDAGGAVPVRSAGPLTGRQPYLHQAVICVRAPAQWISPPDGDLHGGVDGLYVADRRALAGLRLAIAGEPPEPVASVLAGASRARFVAVARGLGDPSADPTVTCHRERSVTASGGSDTIRLENRARVPVGADVTIRVASDLARVGDVKAGRAGQPLAAEAVPGGLRWAAPDGVRVELTTSPPAQVDAGAGLLRWTVDVPPAGAWTAEITVRMVSTVARHPAVPRARRPEDAPGEDAPGNEAPFRPLATDRPAPWEAEPPRLHSGDRRADDLVGRGVADLAALRLCDPAAPSDSYFAAGAPWYLTLFGRDALWSALLALPLGVEPLAGTLRTLARRQGGPDAPPQERGKIPHELRSPDAAVWLPPVYYGTVDATPLFVSALAEAWRWGMPPDDVVALIPNLERALGWLAGPGDADGDGLIEYMPTGGGLVNQGWKDSADGVQWADGRVARPPLALAEVQAYAYRAALDGAAVLDAFDRPGSRRWRDWAAGLAERFRRSYWVRDSDGPYPAIALDGGKRAVDGPASNMGHLLGTGLLRPSEEAWVARRLAADPLAGGYGLRTLATTARGFNPLSYHVGSVWPHDTMIAALGLARAGFVAESTRLVGGLLGVAAHFDHRLPELYGGYPADGHAPVPYPAACRPQAWAAAAGPALVRLLLGLDVDVPAGQVTLCPPHPSPVGAFEVRDVRLAGGRLSVRVDGDGEVSVREAPPGLRVEVRRHEGATRE